MTSDKSPIDRLLADVKSYVDDKESLIKNLGKKLENLAGILNTPAAVSKDEWDPKLDTPSYYRSTIDPIETDLRRLYYLADRGSSPFLHSIRRKYQDAHETISRLTLQLGEFTPETKPKSDPSRVREILRLEKEFLDEMQKIKDQMGILHHQMQKKIKELPDND